MLELTNYLVYPNNSIQQCLDVIQSNEYNLAILTEENKKFISTITKNDIRQLVLKQISFSTPIKNINIRNKIYIDATQKNTEYLTKLLESSNLNAIPIVNHNMEVTEIYSPKNRKIYNNEIIIMAGGVGSRLLPYTQHIPKPLVEINNKPILEILLENFIQQGFYNFTIAVNYKSTMISNYFGNGEKFNAKIKYVKEDKKLGTVGALTLIDTKNLTSPFIVINADILTTLSFSDLIHIYNQNKNSLITSCIRQYKDQIPFGVIETQDKYIKSVVEKPSRDIFISAGIYAINPQIISYIPQNTFYDMPTLINQLLHKNIKPSAFPILEYWIDIGTKEKLEQARNDYLNNFK